MQICLNKVDLTVFFLFIEFVGVILVNKVTQVSAVQSVIHHLCVILRVHHPKSISFHHHLSLYLLPPSPAPLNVLKIRIKGKSFKSWTTDRSREKVFALVTPSRKFSCLTLYRALSQVDSQADSQPDSQADGQPGQRGIPTKLS